MSPLGPYNGTEREQTPARTSGDLGTGLQPQPSADSPPPSVGRCHRVRPTQGSGAALAGRECQEELLCSEQAEGPWPSWGRVLGHCPPFANGKCLLGTALRLLHLRNPMDKDALEMRLTFMPEVPWPLLSIHH